MATTIASMEKGPQRSRLTGIYSSSAAVLLIEDRLFMGRSENAGFWVVDGGFSQLGNLPGAA